MSFDNIINFRDVGASINSLSGSRSVPLPFIHISVRGEANTIRILKEGVLFRSARVYLYQIDLDLYRARTYMY